MSIINATAQSNAQLTALVDTKLELFNNMGENYLYNLFAIETPTFDFINEDMRVEGLLSLTTEAWYLKELGGQVYDKHSLAYQIVAGMVIAKYPELVYEAESEPLIHRAIQGVREVLGEGSTHSFIALDDATSALQFLGACYQCPTTLRTCLDDPMSALEAFYAVQPDSYTKLYKYALSTLMPSVRNELAEFNIQRGSFKYYFINRIYGQGLKTARQLKFPEDKVGEELSSILGKACEKAMKDLTPAVLQHEKAIKAIDCEGKPEVSWYDLLGRKVTITRKADVGKVVETSLGGLHYQDSELDEKAQKYFYSLLANTVHNQDSTVPAYLADIFVTNNLGSFFDGHDEFVCGGANANVVKQGNLAIKLGYLHNDIMKQCLSSIAGYDVTMPYEELPPNVRADNFAQCEHHLNNTHLYCG